MLEKEDAKGGLFRVVKQMVKKNRDVVGGGCVRDADGTIVADDAGTMDIWRRHYEKLMNEEFDWDKNNLENVDAVCGPREWISTSAVGAAIAKSKSGKAAGPSGIVVELLKASGEDGVQWVTNVCNKVVSDGCIPEDWSKSWMVNVYKGKGDALECGSYHGIKLLDHVMKVLERVIEVRVRNVVKVDPMQFGFSPGKGTTDASFIVRQVQEKFLSKRKDLWMAFVDLEKAFDRVPRDVLWWALRYVGVDEWVVNIIKAMYSGATTAVKLKNCTSQEFGVKVGVHQGSVLSPLLFNIVLEALSMKFRQGLPWELLYADDLVLWAESEEELRAKIVRWKNGMESKGLRVNLEKTKMMRCQVGTGQVEDSGAKYPCGVCGKGVGANSIKCTGCLKWIHGIKCSGLAGKLQKVDHSVYLCPMCVGGKCCWQGESRVHSE
jgi:Reverse transcriptase (RNA-dependent DNA polymerase)